jgi:ABC-type Na+ transport system ATPase subunit NatA
MEEAVSICDRIILLNKGKVLIEGTVSDIKKKSGKDNLREAFFELTRRDSDV